MGKRLTLTFTAVIVPDATSGYTACVPALSGCASQGETLRDVQENIRAAATGWVAAIRAHRQDVPADKGADRSARRRGVRVIRIRVPDAPLGRIGRKVAPDAPTQETIGRGYAGDDD